MTQTTMTNAETRWKGVNAPCTVVPGPETRWDELSAACRAHGGALAAVQEDGEEMILLTREAYDRMCSRVELYTLLEEGMEDIRNGRVYPAREAIEEILAELRNETV